MPTPRRRWSQHWLANDDLAAALVRLVEPRSGDRFLEIGAGDGRFTRALLDHPVTVTAVEIDRRCCDILRGLDAEGKLTVIEADVLELQPDALGTTPPWRVVGNLPYAIASPILRWTVDNLACFADAHYMLPAEVAERVLAAPGSRRRGLLSLIVPWEYEGEILKRLGPGSFRPPPKIDSAFIRLAPRTLPASRGDREHRRAVVEAAFAHRRKTLANSLHGAGWDREVIASAIEGADIDPAARAEALSLDEFRRLAEALPEKSG